MAAAVGATVAGKVLGRTKAERAFRPWWDELEDQLIYGLLTLGKIQYSLLSRSDLFRLDDHLRKMFCGEILLRFVIFAYHWTLETKDLKENKQD